MLQVMSTFTLNILSCNNFEIYNDVNTTKSDFDNEVRVQAQLGVSYTKYLQNIIDSFIHTDLEATRPDEGIICFQCKDTSIDCNTKEDDSKDRHIDTFPNGLTAHILNCNAQEPNKIHCDVYLPDKTVGFLNHSVDEFQFIGPDRFPVNITEVDQCLNIASTIASNGLPNYAKARIPLTSGLNIEEWEKELVDYPDKMLIEYFKFGFPLSLSDPEPLNNTSISNHHSALQYPTAVDDYLQKEISLGAIIGPVDHGGSDMYQCLPLLSSPKGNQTRRIILNISHPYGNSVNDRLPRDKFDGKAFTLRFASVDTIVETIITLTDCDPVLYKIYIARAFRNIRVDPV